MDPIARDTLKHSKGTDRDMEFYVSTEYDFETKKWTSGPGYRVCSFGVWFMARPSFGRLGPRLEVNQNDSFDVGSRNPGLVVL